MTGAGLSDDWQEAWQPVIAAIGQELGNDDPPPGADAVDMSAIRRFCEPLEFGCALHFDRETALRHGYPDVCAPYASTISFALPPLWKPGDDRVFREAGRDAQPASSPVERLELPGAPPVDAHFATEISTEFVRPPHVGDRLRSSRPRLVGCVPKQTAVGRGAFVTISTEIFDQADELVATTLMTFFYYVPA